MIQLKRLVENLSGSEDETESKCKFLKWNDSVEETSLECIMTTGWKWIKG